MKKILIVFGTRPEAIKMAPLVKEFLKHAEFLKQKFVSQLSIEKCLDQVLVFFEITPDYRS